MFHTPCVMVSANASGVPESRRVSLGNIQLNFKLKKISERERRIFYVAGKTELIITITNVCCLHLWVYVFISVLVYLCFCPRKTEFQTFGERTVLQSENILDRPQVFVSPKCITFLFAPIFKVGYTEKTKRCLFNVAADAL